MFYAKIFLTADLSDWCCSEAFYIKTPYFSLTPPSYLPFFVTDTLHPFIYVLLLFSNVSLSCQGLRLWFHSTRIHLAI
jgi:hypothetical protein